MIGLLSNDEIEIILRRHRVGRIGCATGNRPYVVPVNYIYDGGFVYSYSNPGRKIHMMREQPRICFEVDEVDGPASWRSVIAEGEYEEITCDDERTRVLKALSRTDQGDAPRQIPDGSTPVIVFRLRLNEKSGRFERRNS